MQSAVTELALNPILLGKFGGEVSTKL